MYVRDVNIDEYNVVSDSYEVNRTFSVCRIDKNPAFHIEALPILVAEEEEYMTTTAAYHEMSSEPMRRIVTCSSSNSSMRAMLLLDEKSSISLNQST